MNTNDGVLRSNPPGTDRYTAVLTLHTRTLCAECEEWIPVGGKAALTDIGWEHVVHLAERGEA